MDAYIRRTSGFWLQCLSYAKYRLGQSIPFHCHLSENAMLQLHSEKTSIGPSKRAPSNYLDEILKDLDVSKISIAFQAEFESMQLLHISKFHWRFLRSTAGIDASLGEEMPYDEA